MFSCLGSKTPCATKTCPSFNVFFWAHTTRCVSVYQLKYSPHKYVLCWNCFVFNVWRLTFVCSSNISDLFAKVNKIHTHKTRSSSSGNFYIKSSSLSLNQRSFARFGAKLWNSYRDKFRQLPKSAFKKHAHDLLLLIMYLIWYCCI